MTIVFVVTLSLLCAAGLVTVFRVVRGRTTMDRIVALDVFLTLVVAATCVGMAVKKDGSNVALLAAFALLGFVGSIASARLVERREQYR